MSLLVVAIATSYLAIKKLQEHENPHEPETLQHLADKQGAQFRSNSAAPVLGSQPHPSEIRRVKSTVPDDIIYADMNLQQPQEERDALLQQQMENITAPRVAYEHSDAEIKGVYFEQELHP